MVKGFDDVEGFDLQPTTGAIREVMKRRTSEPCR